ncbi:hypothetical protein SpCBS45565_g00900 [Spizellomyces sp. 'palustris']|nr:hypothetical protein SpCBS45565_g00900 [Spizellomyces sp. 'palustris']
MGAQSTEISMPSQSKVLTLLRSLISIRSTTLQEQSVVDFLKTYLMQHSWHVHLQPIPDSSPTRHNIYAYRSKSETDNIRTNVKVLLNSHVDTVPPHIELSEDDETLYGRGSCDAKASMAAQICAVEELIEEGKIAEEDVGLLYVVGEETNHIGMIAANSLNINAQYLLVGEPTEMMIAEGHKGMIKADIVVKGQAGHSGYPERGKSAIVALVDILHDLQHTEWPSDPVLGATTLNLGQISGGVAANVIPEHARADISFRISTNAEQVAAQLRTIVEQPRTDGVHVTLSIRGMQNPVRCETVDVDGVEKFVARYFTDIPYLKGTQKPLLFGPGSILVAHSEKEFVKKDDVIRSVRIIKEIVQKLVHRAT